MNTIPRMTFQVPSVVCQYPILSQMSPDIKSRVTFRIIWNSLEKSLFQSEAEFYIHKFHLFLNP